MKRKHQFAFYCSFLVPIGALAGIEVGHTLGLPRSLLVVGVGFGIVSSHLLLRCSARHGDTP